MNGHISGLNYTVLPLIHIKGRLVITHNNGFEGCMFQQWVRQLPFEFSIDNQNFYMQYELSSASEMCPTFLTLHVEKAALPMFVISSEWQKMLLTCKNLNCQPIDAICGLLSVIGII